MKKMLIDILLGFAVVIVVTIFEFLVTLPFGDPGELSPEGYSTFINRELLLTALPAALTTFILTWVLHTKITTDLLRRAVVWTSMIALSYVFIGLGNDNLLEIFRTIGIYVLLASAFAGPIIYFFIKHSGYKSEKIK
jgi:hypothetical protein